MTSEKVGCIFENAKSLEVTGRFYWDYGSLFFGSTTGSAVYFLSIYIWVS